MNHSKAAIPGFTLGKAKLTGRQGFRKYRLSIRCKKVKPKPEVGFISNCGARK